MAQRGDLVGRANAAGERRGCDPGGIDALAVVLDLDDNAPTRVVRANGEDPFGRLTRCDPGLDVLDAVVDSVTHQMHQRILDRLEQGTVELGVTPAHLQAHLAAARGRQVTDNPGHPGPETADGLHPRRHDAFLQLRGNQAQSLGRPYEIGIELAANEPGDLVAHKHELANLAHEVVQDVDVDADRRAGRCDWPRIAGQRLRVGSRDVRVRESLCRRALQDRADPRG